MPQTAILYVNAANGACIRFNVSLHQGRQDFTSDFVLARNGSRAKLNAEASRQIPCTSFGPTVWTRLGGCEVPTGSSEDVWVNSVGFA